MRRFVGDYKYWFMADGDTIKSVLDDCKSLYPVAGYASITIPSYPCGQIGMVMASLNPVSGYSKHTHAL